MDLHHALHNYLAVLAQYNSVSANFKNYFHEGMFKTPNQKGFYEVLNFLLNLVDSQKCKKKYYWPLIDKKDEMEFRKGVQELIAEINKEDETACIPKLEASMLHVPYGDKIVSILIRLSQYAIQKILKNKFNNTEIIQKPQSMNEITSRVFIKMTKQNVEDLNENLCRLKEKYNKLVTESSHKFKTYEDTHHNLDLQRKRIQQELTPYLKSSHVPEELKSCILNNDNSTEEWRNYLIEKMDHYETLVLNLEQINQKINDFRILEENAGKWNASPPCLDRDCLEVNIPASISQKLTIPVYNDVGELLLKGFLNYAKYLSEELTKLFVEKYPKSENSINSMSVLEGLIKSTQNLHEMEKILDDKLLEVRSSISEHQTIYYPYLEQSEQNPMLETAFESPKVNFQDNLDASNIYLRGDGSNQLVGQIKKKICEKNKHIVLCSIKHKPSSTTFKTVTRIPSLSKKYPKSKLMSPLRKEGFSRLTTNKKLCSPYTLSSDKQLETERLKLKTPSTNIVPARPKKLVYSRSSTKLVQKRKFGPSFLQSSSTSNSSTRRSTGSWESMLDSMKPLEKTLSPLQEGFDLDNLLDMSKSTSSDSDIDHNNAEANQKENCPFNSNIFTNDLSNIEELKWEEYSINSINVSKEELINLDSFANNQSNEENPKKQSISLNSLKQKYLISSASFANEHSITENQTGQCISSNSLRKKYSITSNSVSSNHNNVEKQKNQPASSNNLRGKEHLISSNSAIIDCCKIEDIKQNNLDLKEERPTRRKSLQALVDKYKEHKQKYKLFK